MTARVLVAASMMIASSIAFASQGEALFKSNGCPLCHHPEEDRMEQGLGPSLAQVAEAYRGDSDAMQAFLRGKAEPRVFPEHFVIMKGRLVRIASLSDEHLNALVEFILDH